MRTNIEIDDKLMERAMRSSGATTKKAAVDAALKLLVKLQAQGEDAQILGKGEVGGRSR